MTKSQTMGWVHAQQATPQCADCQHIQTEGRMCCCILNHPGFPMLTECDDFDEFNPEAA